ncbi:cwf21 domain-containing protein [Cercophora scortea]|uniref:Cwf21 domain-containing protein n=1 Tax=Cercophora scortea TaxID=314031 RepID=A0AAE0IY63_9PEZI|nr:cwf21 domain-containing protein [Cercophora scortea]
MSDNVGLSTPRGSGTSGYVQRNLAHARPRDMAAPYPRDLDSLRHRQRQPDQGLLEHDRKREVEVKVFELRDKLEDEGIDEEVIDTRCDELRKKLLAEMEKNHRRGGASTSKNLKMHQVHELADAKIKESERLRQALKISRDYEEGSHWRKQEERVKKASERDAAAPAPAPAAAPASESRDRERERERERDRERDGGRDRERDRDDRS